MVTSALKSALGELCHWYVIVALALVALAVVAFDNCVGCPLKQIDWVPVIVPGESMVFSISVTEVEAVHPLARVTITETIELLVILVELVVALGPFCRG